MNIINRPKVKFRTSLLFIFILSLMGCGGNDSTEVVEVDQDGEDASIDTLFITNITKDSGSVGQSVTLEMEGINIPDAIVVLGTTEITPDTISSDFSSITFTVPEGATSGAIRIKQDDVASNALWFSVSESGVVAPADDKVITDSEGNMISIGYVMVSLFEASDTSVEAERLAAIVSGEVIGRISLVNTWQISVDVTSVEELQAIADTLELEASVDFTFFDLSIDGEEIDWSGDPDRALQRDRNRVEEGATLYENNVHPTLADKVRPFFMSIGVSEEGVNFGHNDFSGYGESGTSTSGNVSIYALQADSSHGSNVTGIIAAELGDQGNAGLIRALSASHGGANISVGINGGKWGAGRISKTELQLESGARVINWSWGIHRSGALNCTGEALTENVVSDREFTNYSKLITKLFTKLKKEYPSAVIVSSAGNGATDAGDVTNRLPTSIEADQLIVVGAHTSGGTISSSLSEDDESSTSCFDETVETDVKRATYSNYGSRIDISASGSIMGLDNDTHAVGNRGTSYAAPMVTTTVALMQSINPNLTPTQIKAFLRSSALPIENKVIEVSTAGTVTDEVFTRSLIAEESSSNIGKGARLNVEGAIQAALDSLNSDDDRIVDAVDVSLGSDITEITKTIELVIPDEGAIFDKVDIMFLVDVSGSYGDDIDTFKTKADELVNAFYEAGSNTNVGVASFSDFPESPYGVSSDYAYKLDQALTNDIELVKDGINNLDLLNGNDYLESQLEGLYQTAQAESGWREGALPVIFIATDANFHDSDEEADYPGRGYSETLSYLNAQSIRVFGLQSGGSVSDVVEITEATSGEAFDLSRDSSEIVSAVEDAITNTNNDITVELQPFGDFSGLVSSITPLVEGAVAGDIITEVNPGDTVKFDVVFTKGSFTGETTQTFSFRFKVVAEGVATILEVPVTVVLN